MEQEAFLAECASLVGDALAIVRGELLALSAAQLLWKPAQREWNVGQCLDHLVVSGNLYIEKIEPLISQGGAPRGPLRQTFTGRMITRMVRPECKLKVPVPKAFKPRDLFPPSVASDLLRQGDRLLALLRTARDKDLSAKVVSPGSKLVRVNLADCFAILAEHTRRHVLQAQSVTRHPGFPAAEVAAAP